MEKQITRTERYKFQCIFSVILLIFSISASSQNSSLKPRLVVLTDISLDEPDDHQSLIRLLAHADMYEIEGIVLTTGCAESFQTIFFLSGRTVHGGIKFRQPEGVSGLTMKLIFRITETLESNIQCTIMVLKGTLRPFCISCLMGSIILVFQPRLVGVGILNGDWAKTRVKATGIQLQLLMENEGIEILKESPRQGTNIILDASKSHDPDSDKLTFKWWIQSEAGTYEKEIILTNENTSAV